MENLSIVHQNSSVRKASVFLFQVVCLECIIALIAQPVDVTSQMSQSQWRPKCDIFNSSNYDSTVKSEIINFESIAPRHKMGDTTSQWLIFHITWQQCVQQEMHLRDGASHFGHIRSRWYCHVGIRIGVRNTYFSYVIMVAHFQVCSMERWPDFFVLYLISWCLDIFSKRPRF